MTNVVEEVREEIDKAVEKFRVPRISWAFETHELLYTITDLVLRVDQLEKETKENKTNA